MRKQPLQSNCFHQALGDSKLKLFFIIYNKSYDLHSIIYIYFFFIKV